MVSAGLPNITGTIGCGESPAELVSGAFYGWKDGFAGNTATGGGTDPRVSFSAQKSNAIYGASNTVQPPAIVLVPQIKY